MELLNRDVAGYPPFSRLIRVELRHSERDFLEGEASAFVKLLKPQFQSIMFGPEYPQVARIRNLYRLYILIKISKNLSVIKIKEAVNQCIENYYHSAKNKTMRIIVDVDPR